MAKDKIGRRGVDIKIARTIEPWQEFIFKLVDGLVATDGIQRSPVATIGTTGVEVLSKLLDPGLDFKLLMIEVGLTQRFDNLNAASVGTANYYWQMRQENVATTRAWVNFTGTLAKGVPTSGVAGDPVEDTFSGYVNVGSVPECPVRLRLMAVALADAQFLADVKNSSYAKLAGLVIPVIPGT